MNVNETKSEFKMSETILKELKKIKREIYKNNQDFKNTYILLKEEGASEEELEEVKKALKSTFESYNSVNEDIKDYEKKYNEFLAVIEADGLKIKETKLTEFYALEKKLCEKYFMDQKAIRSAEEPNKTVNESKKRKSNKISAVAMIAALVAALALGHVTAPAIQSYFQTRQEQNIDDEEDNKENSKKPLKLGEPGTFLDASNDEQVLARAQYYFDKYINVGEDSEYRASELPVEVIANDIRMISGQFKQDDSGNITYNSTQIIDTAKNLHSIANFDSFSKYNNNIMFTPKAPLFIDGSKAQKAVQMSDEKMQKVVEAIRKDDVNAFVEAAKEWGILFYNICERMESTPEYPSIWKLGNAEGFQVYHAMKSTYASTILEYSQARKLNICIPYCIDYNTGKTEEEALSIIVNRIDEKIIDAVAVRAGTIDEYVENNLSLPEHLFQFSKMYYDDIFEQQIGYAPKLK